MNDPSHTPPEERPNEFERLASEKPSSLVAEFWFFLRDHKKWWLVPLLLTLAVYAVFLIVSISGGPAFIYTLF